jgi:hypothetical protein
MLASVATAPMYTQAPVDTGMVSNLSSPLQSASETSKLQPHKVTVLEAITTLPGDLAEVAKKEWRWSRENQFNDPLFWLSMTQPASPLSVAYNAKKRMDTYV